MSELEKLKAENAKLRQERDQAINTLILHQLIAMEFSRARADRKELH